LDFQNCKNNSTKIFLLAILMLLMVLEIRLSF
jgi:hypothetical protein